MSRKIIFFKYSNTSRHYQFIIYSFSAQFTLVYHYYFIINSMLEGRAAVSVVDAFMQSFLPAVDEIIYQQELIKNCLNRWSCEKGSFVIQEVLNNFIKPADQKCIFTREKMAKSPGKDNFMGFEKEQLIEEEDQHVQTSINKKSQKSVPAKSVKPTQKSVHHPSHPISVNPSSEGLNSLPEQSLSSVKSVPLTKQQQQAQSNYINVLRSKKQQERIDLENQEKLKRSELERKSKQRNLMKKGSDIGFDYHGTIIAIKKKANRQHLINNGLNINPQSPIPSAFIPIYPKAQDIPLSSIRKKEADPVAKSIKPMSSLEPLIKAENLKQQILSQARVSHKGTKIKIQGQVIEKIDEFQEKTTFTKEQYNKMKENREKRIKTEGYSKNKPEQENKREFKVENRSKSSTNPFPLIQLSPILQKSRINSKFPRLPAIRSQTQISKQSRVSKPSSNIIVSNRKHYTSMCQQDQIFK